jgi:signal peptidase I
MISYIHRENKREAAGKGINPYKPFVDAGPPLLSNGQLNTTLIKEFGLTIPPKMYLALGDNYANSSDSRDFGFVPQENIRGAPDWIFWPPGNRWGAPNQPDYPLFNLPRTIIWLLAALCIGIWWIIHQKQNRLPLKLD